MYAALQLALQKWGVSSNFHFSALVQFRHNLCGQGATSLVPVSMTHFVPTVATGQNHFTEMPSVQIDKWCLFNAEF